MRNRQIVVFARKQRSKLKSFKEKGVDYSLEKGFDWEQGNSIDCRW